MNTPICFLFHQNSIGVRVVGVYLYREWWNIGKWGQLVTWQRNFIIVCTCERFCSIIVRKQPESRAILMTMMVPTINIVLKGICSTISSLVAKFQVAQIWVTTSWRSHWGQISKLNKCLPNLYHRIRKCIVWHICNVYFFRL